MTADPLPSAMTRLLAWDYDRDGNPPPELLAEHNADMGGPPAWVQLDDDIAFGAHFGFEYPDWCYLLSGGPFPAHAHERGRHLPLVCQYQESPDLACHRWPDHPIHRPDHPIEIWEHADILERYGWLQGLYLLAGGR